MTVRELRKKIDKLDKALLELLTERFTISKKIGKAKTAKSMPIQDKKREKKILERISKKALAAGVNKKFVRMLWNIIFKESKRLQKISKQ